MPNFDRAIGQLARFPAADHDALIATVVESPRIAQLAFSFPLLLMLLSNRYGSDSERATARSAIDEGRPLAEAAAALSIPLSLRHVPPEACCHLPYAPWSSDASRILASLIPKRDDAAMIWLKAIFNARRAADETFALWLARQQPLFTGRDIPELPLRGLAIYSWSSRFAPLPLEQKLSSPWQSDLGLDTACARAGQWAREIAIVADLGPDGLDDPWIDGTTVMGFEFVPLLTPDDLIQEAVAMSNCVATYSDRLARGHSRLYGVRSRARHVATVELEWVSTRMQYGIREMRGPRNCSCPEDVVRATYHWLDRHAPKRAPLQKTDRTKRAKLAGALLHPYLATHPVVTAQSARNALDMLLHVDIVRAELWLATRTKPS